MNPLFSQLEQQYQLPQGYLSNAYRIESGSGTNMGAPGATYQGQFQLGPAVRQQYGVSDPYDLTQSATAAAQLGADNASILRRVLGRDPNGAELYLAHQQGAGGATGLLANPDTPAGQITNPKFIAANGGDPSASASDFVQKWAAKYNGSPSASGGTANAGLGAVGPLATDSTPVASTEDAAPPAKDDKSKENRDKGLDQLAGAFKSKAPMIEADNSGNALTQFMTAHMLAMQKMKQRRGMLA